MSDKLLSLDFSAAGQSLVNVILLWLGFSAGVGLVTRLILFPSRWWKSIWSVFLVGIVGSCPGPLVLTTLCKIDVEKFNPISIAGFLVSVAAAIVVMIFYGFVSLFFHKKSD